MSSQYGELASCDVFERCRLFFQGVKMALVLGPIGIADSLDEQCSPVYPKRFKRCGGSGLEYFADEFFALAELGKLHDTDGAILTIT